MFLSLFFFPTHKLLPLEYDETLFLLFDTLSTDSSVGLQKEVNVTCKKSNSDKNVLLTYRPCLNFSTATGPWSLLSKSLCIESERTELFIQDMYVVKSYSHESSTQRTENSRHEKRIT